VPYEAPVEVPDAEKHIARATKLGAQVIVPASALPDGDTMAVLRDPAGLPFAICSSPKKSWRNRINSALAARNHTRTVIATTR